MPNPFSRFFSSFRNASQQAQQGQSQGQYPENVPLQIKAFLSTIDDVDQQVSELHGMVYWLQTHTSRQTDEGHIMTIVRTFRKFMRIYFSNASVIRSANGMDDPHQQPIDQGGYDSLRQMLGYINDKLTDMGEEFPFFASYAKVAKTEQEKQAAMEIYKAWIEFFQAAQAELVRYEESNPMTNRAAERKKEPKNMVDSQSPTIRPNQRRPNQR